MTESSSPPQVAAPPNRPEHPLVRKLRDGQATVFKLLQMQPGTIAHGRSVIELQTSVEHSNPMGTVHGGILCDLADAAMGMAFASTLDPDQTFTTLELKINFMRPVWIARLKAEGRVAAKGRTIALVECDIRDEQGRLIAKASSTCMVLRGEQAAGR